MAGKFGLIFLVIILLQYSEQISLPSDPTYNAAVVEFIPSEIVDIKFRVKDNVARIKAILESDETKDLDIIVFPEFVINDLEWMTFVPDSKENIIPCEIPNYDHFLTELSCVVRSRKVYAVFNIVEKVLCSEMDKNCEEDGLIKYNTNIVLDREGRIISRYRKTHLYRYEWYRESVLAKPELATFTTDFGVTFGHFICFDMLFYEPAQVLIKELNITDIIYPTYWFSELPFLTAVQLQEGWAFANNVNLLAADGSHPSGQNTGSGIYAGRLGRLAAVIYEEPTTKVLKAKVPKRNHLSSFQMPPVIKPLFVPQAKTPRFTKLSLLRDYNVDIFNTSLLEPSFTQVDEKLCHNDFCCNFHVKRSPIPNSENYKAYRYRLAAYKGTQTTFQRIDSSNQSVCALIACTGDELYTCGHIFPKSESLLVGNQFYFTAINITGDFAKSDKRLIMPSTVNTVFLPLTVDSYEWLERDRTSYTTIQMNLDGPQQDLLTFGIWANYYSSVKNTHNLDSLTREAQPLKVKTSSAFSLNEGAFSNLLKFLLFGLITFSVNNL